MENKERLQVALMLKSRQRSRVSRLPRPVRDITPIAEERQAQKVIAEQGYDRLEGDWRDWLAVAKKYEHQVLAQDRLDIRHDIILELHRARQRDSKPLPLLRAYRIASLVVALYWRELIKREVKVCLYSGLPTEPHCASCRHKPKDGYCAYLAVRPIESLDKDSDGEARLLDTVADDQAMDIVGRLDAETFLLGCPMRLIEVAQKRLDGIPLNKQEQQYLYDYRRRELKKYQKSLF